MHIPLATYGLLFVAVVFEALGSSFQEKSEGMTRMAPVVFSLCCYGASFAVGTQVLKTMPMGILYSLWCGLGIIIVAVLGYFINKQTLDLPAVIGMALIAAGVMVIYLFSKSAA